MFSIIAISLIEKCKLKIRFFFSLPSFLIAIYGIKVWRNVLKKTVSAFELNNFTSDFVSSLFGLRVHFWQRIFLQRNYYQFFCFTCELITHNSFFTLFLTSLLGVLNLWRISLWLAKVVDPYSSKIAEVPANNSTYRAAKSCRAVVLKKLVGKRRLTCEEELRKAVLFYYDRRWAFLSENIPCNSFLELK